MNKKQHYISVLTLALLASCGGGSDSNEVEVKPEPPTTTPPLVTPTDPETTSVTSNKLGAWLFYIDEPGLVKGDHQAMAKYLAEMGVKRVFIKIHDINYNYQSNAITFDGDSVNCGVWQDACEPSNLAFYVNEGIEPWAWTYNDISQLSAQTDMLYAAAKVGYTGYVMDVEVEFDGKKEQLETLMSAHRDKLNEAVNEGLIDDSFLLGVTTWGNPADHQMAIDVIDQYADFHMPQTYIEKWGTQNDIQGTIEQGDCEYQNLGATKPIWHIVSHEDGILDSVKLNEFIEHAGPNASIWRMHTPELAVDIEQVNWGLLNYKKNECSKW
ncbi:hypothetical protein [Colwellia sp. RSH04]|uniref:hypothetical protein n=1 Tax=Colwellia sp. RSH04 TaxID=2305464 RepID=UPI000E56FFE4|nr:hypothetical protein [Colwellia sp. RSH04]RHW76480.1 hypothetical protein D1094_09225 [Colwellia sp. RSH04]